MATIIISMDNTSTIEVTDVPDPNNFIRTFEKSHQERRTFEITFDGGRKIVLLPQKVSSFEITN